MTSTQTTPEREARERALWAAVAPLQDALHRRADQHPHGSPEWNRYVGAAADITVAVQNATYAIRAGADALEITNPE